MTALQKVIKYCAVAFAIFLIISIVGGIFTALASVATYFEIGGEKKTDGNGEMKTYEISDNIKSLEIDLDAASLDIVSGEGFSLKSDMKNLRVREDGDTLRLWEDNPFITFHVKSSTVVLTVPEDFEFDKADISTGAGHIKADSLSAKHLDMEFGAGRAEFKTLRATERAKIESGAGNVSVSDGRLNDASIDMGTGKFSYTGDFLGNCKIDFGVGSSVVNLAGGEDDYTVKLDHGVGSTTIGGIKVDGDGTYGNGDNIIDIDGGVGSVTVNFSETEKK